MGSVVVPLVQHHGQANDDKTCETLHGVPSSRDSVRVLHYTNHTLRDDVALTILGAYCPNVRVLHAELHSLASAKLECLPTHAFAHLTHLTLVEHPTGIHSTRTPSQILAFLRLLPRLTHLSLTFDGLCDTEASPVTSPVPALPFSLVRYDVKGAFPGWTAPIHCSLDSLHELIVRFNPMGEREDHRREILHAAACVAPRLRLLHIRNCPTDPLELIPVLSRCGRLHHLSLELSTHRGTQLDALLAALPVPLRELGVFIWVHQGEFLDAACCQYIVTHLEQNVSSRRLRRLNFDAGPGERVGVDALQPIQMFCRTHHVACDEFHSE
ncbi:hypothetical protein EXIGLDRAFT_136900 [Exidia glandulosa HHB12029]|uniref:RNI-like protein n=1 Tax=Exidia glandulosa HHB12029 TaxID=1314781 RepID=A0A165G1A5_EXIGL|nr:hypothetical protein EXIGLDRAFT_136900 [Exidia glandulosa HHB12029]